MKTRNRKNLNLSIALLTAFVLWTVAVSFFDVRSIGANGTAVGFAWLNDAFCSLTGVHLFLYELTDVLSLIPLGFVCAFACLGLFQMIRRKSLLRVDRSLIILGIFYIAVAVLFLFFEKCIINYRPILIDGNLEASYPSSTTLLVLTVMPTSMMQLRARMRKGIFRSCVLGGGTLFSVFMVLARLLSGVHWLTDIIGGTLLSAGLVVMYDVLGHQKGEKKPRSY